MRVFLTGGTGFIAGEVARSLRARGDVVRALVRSPEKARGLASSECELIAGDLSDDAAIRAGVEGCDSVIHAAAVYEIGVSKKRHPELWDVNVKGTERVLRAAGDAGVSRIIYVSTIAAFGNTRGRIVDESYVHPGDSYTSVYEETKVAAHEVARRLISEGLPIVIVQPGLVYGPGDTSANGALIDRFLAGKLPMLAFPGVGYNAVHRDDVAAGVLLALDKGVIGESYIIGGEITTLRDLIGTLAKVSGRKSPTRAVPPALIKMAAPLGPVIGPMMGFGPNLREMISSADGVTFWAKDDKARRELGYAPRTLEQGLRDLLAAGDSATS
jgi:nucleoside-diphosphate-sugar epimerase